MSREALRQMFGTMFVLSTSRGVEASGFALLAGDQIEIQKLPVSSSELTKSSVYKSTLAAGLRSAIPNGRVANPLALIGHSRLATNGLEGINANNQPVTFDRTVGVHNGIIVNEVELWDRYPECQRQLEVDTEVLLAAVRHHLGESGDVISACRRAFGDIEGAASVALMFSELDDLLIATNTGSLYAFASEDENFFGFLSEANMVRQFLAAKGNSSIFGKASVRHVTAGVACLVDLESLDQRPFSLAEETQDSNADEPPQMTTVARTIRDPVERDQEARDKLRRCTRCILPDTMPFIEFDDKGVCSYCRDHEPIAYKGREAWEELLSKYRRKDGIPDCIVAFSGGRDSSYALHQLKTEFNMNPIAYTYDWAMVNDLARRNQARLTGKLGVEHIIVSADIPTKRRHINKNVKAWMKRPSLGMVPLFMAGDKQFFYFANRLKKQTGAELLIFAQGPYETTNFKTGFANVKDVTGGNKLELSARNKFSLSKFYLSEFLKNPTYLNSSLFDTVFGFWTYYVTKRNYVSNYDYLVWDEETIIDALVSEYGWEVAGDTSTTWRIGDGTAATYNYIYHTVAGFTENDTFRSNQIREGVISRDQAFAKVHEENQPRFDSIFEYCQVVGVNFSDLMRTIDRMPRLWAEA